MLVRVATEMGETLEGNETIVRLKSIITGSEQYDEIFVKQLADQEKEQVAEARELELKEQERLRELEEKERERQEKERERQEKEQERQYELEQRQYELERLKLANQATSRESLGSRDSGNRSSIRISHVMDKFKGEGEDITLFLSVFEAHARQLDIAPVEWVSQLMGLLPNEINTWLVVGSDSSEQDYNQIKTQLLDMYKFTPEKCRQMFCSHAKGAKTTWNVYARELTNYCQKWISGLKVETYDQLLDLIVTDQMKRKVPADIRAHFVDVWGEVSQSQDLARRLDTYENNRSSAYRKDFSKVNHKEPVGEQKWKKVTESVPSTSKPAAPKADRNAEFDKPQERTCYLCKKPGHIKKYCPQLKSSEKMCHVVDTSAQELLLPHTFFGTVCGNPISFLRDSGATVDLINSKYVRPNQYTGESVWVKQPLDEAPKNLPVAKVEIVGPFCKLVTEAAVAKNCDLEYYILSNRSATLLSEIRQGFLEPQFLCAVRTRAQTAAGQGDGVGPEAMAAAPGNAPAAERPGDAPVAVMNEALGEGAVELGVVVGTSRARDAPQKPASDAKAPDEETCVLLGEVNDPGNVVENNAEFEVDSGSVALSRLDPSEFAKAQRQDEELLPLFELAEGPETERRDYFIERGLLFRKRQSKRGEQFSMLVTPRVYRGTILKLCHEVAHGHLGVTKSKDAMAKYFFWPNCYKDMENYVRSCDSCQRVGNGGEKLRAPLKIVPITGEAFEKVNVDACGPFPESESGNKFILTAMCLATKYPEAIPIRDLTTVTVIEALLDLFSRIGFPRELQTDQGTCFTSTLMAEFAERFCIRLIRSSPYHPQSNAVERMHRTMNRLMKVLCLEARTDWECQLPAIMFALRTSVHESIGFSPAELVYGKNLRTPMTLLYEKLAGAAESEESTVVEHVFKLINRLKRSRELAHTKMAEEQRKRKVWYDRKAISRSFEIGAKVLVLAPNRTRKLAVQWVGPGEVREKMSEHNYVVQMPGRKEPRVYHINMMKKYHQRTEYVNFLGSATVTAAGEEDALDRYALRLDSDDFDAEEMLNDTKVEPEFREALKNVICKYRCIFSEKPGLTDVTTMDIELTDTDKVVRSAPYRMSPRQTKILREEVDKMLRDNIIVEAESDYTSPMILIEAPGKSPRPCIDFRRLNEIIKTDYFPLPNLEERIEQVAAAKIISVLDLSKCFWQIGLTDRAQRYSAFVTSFGTYRPLRLPFGIKNGPYQCCKIMGTLLKNCQEFAVPYLDDIAVFSNTWQEHIRHLDTVFSILKSAKLTVQPRKCLFARANVKYLGYVVGNGKLRPAEAKIQAIQNFPRPESKKQVRSLLGLVGYYRRLIPGFAEKAAALTDALRGRERQGKVVWTEACEKSFNELRQALSEKTAVYAPDYSKEFRVQADASQRGLGVVLYQVNDEGVEQPVVFLSRKLSDTETHYGTSELECLALIWGLDKLKIYLDGQATIQVETDHNPLVWLRNTSGKNPRLLRWSLLIQHLDLRIMHKKGSENVNADALSRMFDDVN